VSMSGGVRLAYRAVGELAAAISELIKDPEEARALGERARVRCVEHYSMHRIGKRLLAVLTGAVSAKGDIER